MCCTLVENINNLLKDKHIIDKKIFNRKVSLKGMLIPLIPTSIDKNLSVLKNKNISPSLGQHNHLIKKL